MKILNLYAGIGGNRKLWGDEDDITAIEIDPKIAAIYQDFFPKDKMIITDAHQYLLEHFKEYDFIWSSPPCPTHNRMNHLTNVRSIDKNCAVKYPDMVLYQEIIILKTFFSGKFCIENVIGYYEPLIPPVEVASHYYWVNFYLPVYTTPVKRGTIRETDEFVSEKVGFNVDKYKGIDKRKILNNCVEPETGLYIFNQMKLSLKKSELF